MDNKYNIEQDDKLREIFSGTKIKAGENLKYRIMQQIATESVLKQAHKKERKINLQIKTILTLAGAMYALLLVVAGAAFLYAGKEALMTSEFFMSVIFIAVITATLGAISYFDTNKNYVKKKA